MLQKRYEWSILDIIVRIHNNLTIPKIKYLALNPWFSWKCTFSFSGQEVSITYTRGLTLTSGSDVSTRKGLYESVRYANQFYRHNGIHAIGKYEIFVCTQICLIAALAQLHLIKEKWHLRCTCHPLGLQNQAEIKIY